MNDQASIIEYVICGPGRCGGHLLAGLIRATGVKVLRTHDVKYSNSDDPHTAWIDVDRADIFDAVCSNILANRTGQSTHYDRQILSPFYASKSEFQRLYQNHLTYRQNRQNSRRFARRDLFWYEEFAQNWCMVWQKLSLTPIKELLESDNEVQRLIKTPAPYNYRDVIINYKELREFVID